MSLLAKALKALRGLTSPRSEAPQVLHVAEVGLTLNAPDGSLVWSFQWADVRRVETFKRDLLCVDMICIAFETSVHPETLIAHDEMAGFCELCEQLGSRLPGIPEGWWRSVAFPAFATNFAVLFRRD
jgi:hypothetical protein